MSLKPAVGSFLFCSFFGVFQAYRAASAAGIDQHKTRKVCFYACCKNVKEKNETVIWSQTFSGLIKLIMKSQPKLCNSRNKVGIRGHLVVVLHQLDDHPDVVRVVLDGDDPHDVGSILGIRVLAVLVGQNQTSISLVNLGATKVDRSAPGT